MEEIIKAIEDLMAQTNKAIEILKIKIKQCNKKTERCFYNGQLTQLALNQIDLIELCIMLKQLNQKQCPPFHPPIKGQ